MERNSIENGAEQLHAKGKQVRLVNRSGKAPVPAGIEVVAGDALDATATRMLSQGAMVVYNCVNVPYTEWAATLFRLQDNLIEGANAADAKLIITDTLYMYGETHGTPMIDLPHSYSYMKDVARGLIMLGERDEALGRDWLLPVAPAVTQGEICQMIGKHLDYPLRM